MIGSGQISQDGGRQGSSQAGTATVVRIPAAGVMVEAELALPAQPTGLVVIVPGIGEGRRRPHIRTTSARLGDAGWATVLVELLTPGEECLDELTAQLRLDIGLLAGRIAGVLDWLRGRHDMTGLPVGLVGAGRGAAAALLTAARRPGEVNAVVSRGAHPGLGSDTLARVTAPTLLIADDRGTSVSDVARQTAHQLGGPAELRLVPDADRRCLEPGPLNQILSLTCDWFARHLTPGPAPRHR
jgi:dienelactone hydrolase